ncbi:uncharacterized protein [Triticum aestivum]|uniref:uncharacterized protein n=1 Tax=Triticum aestivum TaxID=4565 RepID=UPI001D002B6B|nr:uncharacterized protein LOC123189659 [Triticum aestivum]
MAVATRSSRVKIRRKEMRWDAEKRRENRDCAATSCRSGGGSGHRIQPLPVSLRRPKMVRLGAALTAERVLSTERGSSTQAILHNASEDTTLSKRSSRPRAVHAAHGVSISFGF